MRIYSLFILLFCAVPFMAYNQNIEHYIKDGDIAKKAGNYNDAFAFYESAAVRGSEYASLEVGKIIYAEKIYIKDYKPYLSIFSKLSAKGNTESKAYLGYLYYIGRGFTFNYDSAYKYFKEAEQKSDPYALSMLGIMYFFGKGVNQNYLEARIYFEKARLLKDYKAVHWLSSIYENGYGIEKDVPKAIKLLEEGCLNGDSYCYGGIAYHYQFGIGMATNLRMAIIFYRDAIRLKQDNVIAKFYLSLIYADNKSVFFDEAESNKLYNEAVKAAAPFDLYNWGKFYTGTAEYKERAFTLLQMAEAKGEPLATFHQGLIYYQGLMGISKDMDHAGVFFNKAVNSGLTGYGNYYLGLIEYSKKNWTGAIVYFEKAKKVKDISAIVVLAQMYATDSYGVKNIQAAKDLFKEAADLGDTFAKKEYDKLNK